MPKNDASAEKPLDELARRLRAYYQNILPIGAGAQVGDLEMLPAGWESDLYAFTLQHELAGERAREKLVLRLYSGLRAREKAAHEFAVLSRLRQAGYPVPRLHLLESDPSPFGRPFVIMERIDGPVMWDLMLNGGEGEQKALLNTFCQLFVRLHDLDWQLFIDEAGRSQLQNPYVFVDRWFTIAHSELERFPVKGFLPVIEWLQARRKALACQRPALVHRDFHPGNILFRKDRSPVVIDWTGSQVSDARFDLAWSLLLAYAYLGTTWRERILKGYEAFVGEKVAGVEQFEVFACLRRLFDLAVSLSQGPGQRGMRQEAVAEMRADKQAHELVYQLLVARTGIQVREVERLIASL